MRAPYCQTDSNDKALRAHGCTLFTVLYLRRFASQGDEAPVSQTTIDKDVWDLQRDSGATMAQFLARGTKLDEAENAFEHDRVPDRVPLLMRKYHGGSVRQDLLPRLRQGMQALVCVNYGVVVDAGHGKVPFRGGHAVAVGDVNDTDHTVGVADPLRKALTRWPIEVLETAMERFGKKPWGNGRGEFGTVRVAPTWLALARKQRDEALADLKACQAQLPQPK